MSVISRAEPLFRARSLGGSGRRHDNDYLGDTYELWRRRKGKKMTWDKRDSRTAPGHRAADLGGVLSRENGTLCENAGTLCEFRRRK